MAEVVDIVHNLVYNANTDAIEAVNKEFSTQFKQITELEKKIQEYDNILEKTGQDEIQTRKTLSTLIDQNKRKIDELKVAIGRQFAEAGGSIRKTTADLKNLTFAGSQLVREAPAFAFSLQTGLIGISNNIPILIDELNKAKAAGKSTTEIFGALGGSIFGLSSLISIAIPLLINFGGKLFDTADGAKEATKEYDKFIKALGDQSQQAIENTVKQIDKLKVLKDIIKGGTDASDLAFAEYKKQFPVLLKDIKTANELLANPQVLREIDRQIEAKEKSNSATAKASMIIEQQKKELVELEKLLVKQENTQERVNRLTIAAAEVRGTQREEGVLAQLRQAGDDLIKVDKEVEAKRTLTKGLAADRQANLNEAARQGEIAKDLIFQDIITENERKAQEEQEKQEKDSLERRKRILEAYHKEILELRKQEMEDFSTGWKKQQEDIAKATAGFVKLLLDRDILASVAPTGRFADEMAKFLQDRFTAAKSGAGKLGGVAAGLSDDVKEDVGREAFNKQAKLTRDLLIQFADDVFNHQAELLDREIALRQERVNQAVELAKYGNTELLKVEQERLNEVAAEREKVARQQLQLDALLRASAAATVVVQSLQTITNAGSTGDPYTIAIRIAAAVAALTAGFTAVKALTSGIDAFAEGVVDYKGKGTGKSDSNYVRISNGESVITADATKRHAPILRAMNAGNFKDVRLSSRSGMAGSGYNKQFADLTDAVRDSKLKQDIFFNERGVGIMTQRAIRRDKRRWG